MSTDMRALLSFALVALFPGCITVQVASDGPQVERSLYDPEPSRAPEGPSLSAGSVVDAFVVEASDEHGTLGRVVLEEGVDYLVTIEGTFSVWAPQQWRRVCAGSPDIGPQHRSIVRTGPAGLDAAYAFAVPNGSSLCSRATPMTNPGWLYRLRPEAPWAAGPTEVSYSPDHTYRFPFVGAGAPLAVAVRDVAGQYGDNYGRLRVTVLRPVS